MRIIALAAAVFLSACSPDAERHAPVAPSGPQVQTIEAQMAAFNAHDPEAMRAFWHEDVTWIEINGAQASTVTTSAEQLYGELVVYFETYPDVSSSLEEITVNGNYLTAVERPVWVQDGEQKSQASIVVYEFDGGKIKRFWYYPPQ